MDFKASKLRLEELDVQAADMKRRAKALYQEVIKPMKDAYAENRRKRAAETPLHMLPNDVLKLILEAAYDHRPSEGCSKGHVLTVSHVSRRLRQLALSLPRLWRCIHIGPPTPFLELVLSRTANFPLFIVIDTEGYRTREDHPPDGIGGIDLEPRHVAHLNRLFESYAERIAYLSIATDNYRILRLTHSSLQCQSYPLMKAIELSAKPSTLDDENLYQLPQCPNLQTLSLRAIPASFYNANFESLTALDIFEMDLPLNFLRNVAQECPNLRVLRLDTVEIEDDDEDDDDVYLPRLETLRLAHLSEPEPCLDCFDAPALSTLVLVSCGLPSIELSTRDSNDLRPFASVRCLRLANMDTVDDPPFDGSVLRYAPCATTLELRHCGEGEGSLIEYLADADPPPLPALQTLIVVGLQNEEALDAVLRVAYNQIQHEVPLREVQLGKDVREAMDEELLRMLQELAAVTTAADADDSEDI
ncbi:hypothetical protein PsYK624_025980 [Phanerochaete sordida]|uniref:F-box domain-containing protein n=1 Tax=Phanerochaete sordida TaxID=48140 RepID=A0A9P3LA09_9APHY|nr:hypothetical protein PsYK624_025980 [Phanerochaete sordida]